jgi:ATP-binding cassette subfamily B protein
MATEVNLKKILYESVTKNKGIIMSIITLLTAYWIQDVIFFGSFSKFTTDVPKFMKNMSFTSIMGLIFPYIIAEFLFYINNIIVSYAIPEIELSVVEGLTKETLKSVKTAKTIVNTNEYIMNLKKVIESKSVYYLFVSNIVPTFLIAIGMIYYFSQYSFQIGAIVLAIMVMFIYVTMKLCKSSVYASYENENAVNMLYDNIQDIMANSDLVVTSNAIDKEATNICNDKKTVYDTYLLSEIISSEASFKLRLLSLSMVFLLDFIAMYLYYSGNMKLELVISICTMSIIFLKYFNTTVSRFRNTVGYISKFYEIDDYFAKFKIFNEQELNNDLVLTIGNIEFKDINLNFEGKEIFSSFNFKVNGGIKVGIIGDMGTGKTSILKMLAGLINYSGEILIDGQDIKKCNYNSVMKNIAYISQQPRIFNKDIYYNLSYGTNKTEKDVDEYLNQINFSEFFNLFPKGIRTIVGKEGSKLSGGQKQLIAIVRALLQNKSIILLDEPTNSLDIQTKKIIADLISKIKNKTILIVTHDQSILDLFDDFIILK